MQILDDDDDVKIIFYGKNVWNSENLRNFIHEKYLFMILCIQHYYFFFYKNI